MSKLWNTAEAIALCRIVESEAPSFGCHVALTGGLLYKDGDRKDADLLFYRIRQVAAIDIDGLFAALEKHGLKLRSGFGFCRKAIYAGKNVDCFFPEAKGGDYDADGKPVEKSTSAPGFFALLADSDGAA